MIKRQESSIFIESFIRLFTFSSLLRQYFFLEMLVIPRFFDNH